MKALQAKGIVHRDLKPQVSGDSIALFHLLACWLSCAFGKVQQPKSRGIRILRLFYRLTLPPRVVALSLGRFSSDFAPWHLQCILLLSSGCPLPLCSAL